MAQGRGDPRKTRKKKRSGAGKVSGGYCQHTGFVYYPNLAAARKVAAADEDAVSCAYCKGAHVKAAKRRKQSQRNNNR